MLLIDGTKYQEWTLDSEDKLTEDDLEQMVIEHSDDIFGEDSIYLDKKYKLKTITGVGSIPDGFAIIFSNQPEWHIVEVELSSHDIYEHVVKQVTKFMDGIENLDSKDNLFEAIWNGINSSYLLKHKLEKASGSSNPHWFLSNIIKKNLPIITLIIEKEQPGLKGTLSKFTYLPHKIVEFRTFRREGVGLAVHAHLFKPIFQAPAKILATIKPKGEIITTRKTGGRVTIKDLTDANILKIGQIIHGWHGDKRYEGEVLSNGNIAIVHTGEVFDSPSGAASQIRGYQEDGWRWWHTKQENGSEYKLAELRKKYDSNLSP